MKKIFSSLVLIASGVGSASLAHAVTISTAIPGTTPNGTSSTPGAFVANFYNFALIIGGVLAFAVIIYGGIKYMTSGGNPSGASDAKEWIEAALLGLLLLAGAYFVLSVVNPQLLNLKLPDLGAANVAAPTTQNTATAAPAGTTPNGTSCTPVGNTTNGTCAVGQSCDSTGVGYVCHGAASGAQTLCGGNFNGPCANSAQTCYNAAGNNGVAYQCMYTCGVNGNANGSCQTGTTCQPGVYSGYQCR